MKPGFASIDTETTGTHGDARIIEIAVITYSHSGKLLEEHESLVHGDGTVGDQYAQGAHKIKSSQLSSAPIFKHIWPEFETILNGNFVIAHNSSFDLSRINFELERIRAKKLTEIACTLKLARELGFASRQERGSGTLEGLVRQFGIRAVPNHQALDDCRALAKIFFHMKEERLHDVSAFLHRFNPYVASSRSAPKSGMALARGENPNSALVGFVVNSASNGDSVNVPKSQGGTRRPPPVAIEERCGATRSDGGRCISPAGSGTSHPGTGRCVTHESAQRATQDQHMSSRARTSNQETGAERYERLTQQQMLAQSLAEQATAFAPRDSPPTRDNDPPENNGEPKTSKAERHEVAKNEALVTRKREGADKKVRGLAIREAERKVSTLEIEIEQLEKELRNHHKYFYGRSKIKRSLTRLAINLAIAREELSLLREENIRQSRESEAKLAEQRKTRRNPKRKKR